MIENFVVDTIEVLILSVAGFLIVIGSLGACLPCDQCPIMWVSNYGYPISTFCNCVYNCVPTPCAHQIHELECGPS